MAKLILTKSQKIKLAIYAGLILGTLIFGVLFKINYSRYMAHGVASDTQMEEKVSEGTRANAGVVPVELGTLFIYGGLFVFFSVALGLTVGRYLSGMAAEKLVNTLHSADDASQFINHADYEKAEEAYIKGNFLESIELFREYFAENPNEVHTSIRIAEIYEKDLNNPLAAAMEYEEILKQKLPDEQWGWTAIHLCNLYIAKLDRPQDAIALMKRIAKDYEFTAAAAKARQHLERMGEEIPSGESEELPEEFSAEEKASEKKKRKINKNLPASEQFKDMD